MNECSFINKRHSNCSIIEHVKAKEMGRATDENRIEAIRLAAVEVVSAMGIEKSSVAMIAARAGVSAGYLYRHYAGKTELIRDLVEQSLNKIVGKIEQMATQSDNVPEIVARTVEFIIQSGSQNSHKHKFLIMLYADFSLELGTTIRTKIEDTGKMLIELGHRSGTLSDIVSVEDLFMAIIGVPMQYLATRYRLDLDRGARTEEQQRQHIIDIAVEVIKR